MTAMDRPSAHVFSRRERQIMDVLYARGEATALEIQRNIPDAPSYAATRRLIAILEEKGHVRHRAEGTKYVYSPTGDVEAARETAVRHLKQTFFNGSTARAVTAMLDLGARDLKPEELDQLAELIEKARREGR